MAVDLLDAFSSEHEKAADEIASIHKRKYKMDSRQGNEQFLLRSHPIFNLQQSINNKLDRLCEYYTPVPSKLMVERLDL